MYDDEIEDRDTEQTAVKSVTLIAYVYEWLCPNCEEWNKCERASSVTCGCCEMSFTVRGIDCA